MSTHALSTQFIKDTDLVTRDIAGEIIIVPVRSGTGDLESIYTLNEMGARIWELVDGQGSVDQIVQSIANEYDVSVDEAERDVIDFLAMLEAEGLIWRRIESEA
jgi:hypothetical protein